MKITENIGAENNIFIEYDVTTKTVTLNFGGEDREHKIARSCLIEFALLISKH